MNRYRDHSPSSPQVLLFATLALAISLALDAMGSVEVALVSTSIAEILLGIYVFIDHGGDYITPTGVFFGAFALFVGLAGLFVLLAVSDPVEPVLTASLAAYASTLLLYGLLLSITRRWRRRVPEYLESGHLPLVVNSWTWKLGVVLIASGLLLNQANLRLGQLESGLAFVGLTSLFLGLVASATSREATRIVPRIVSLAVGLFLFFEVFFDGFGRFPHPEQLPHCALA